LESVIYSGLFARDRSDIGEEEEGRSSGESTKMIWYKVGLRRRVEEAISNLKERRK